MVVFPNCKINLGLNILRKRGDGFHDLETVFYPIPINDVLEIIRVKEETQPISFTTGGLSVDGNKDDNLCLKAYRLLKKDIPALPAIQMYLYKTIPAGAGLGGGSADALFTIKLLNKLFDLKLTDMQIHAYAISLGSDCPFFMINRPCFATGKGELLEPIPIDLSFYKLVLINPAIIIHTANAFAQTTPALPQHSIKEIIQQPVTTWKENLKNDFENSVFRQFHEIKKIKDELYDAGAIYASMSGSGSTVYGIFEKEKKLQFNFPLHYFVRELNL